MTWFLVHADGVARREQSGDVAGKRVGLIQAYADVFNDHWRLRAGEFWLPTSRENTDPLWTSKYTITYSALNSWMAQEVRPIGADLQWSPTFYVTAGVTAFRGNDTMGTLLADRGWTFGNYLAAYDENLPTPEPALTRPFGEDLDSKNGYAERIRVSLPERAMLQFTHIDNRATISPVSVKGQEPWQTHFNIVGAEVGSTGPTTVAAEWMRGSTDGRLPRRQLHDEFRHRLHPRLPQIRPRTPQRPHRTLHHQQRVAPRPSISPAKTATPGPSPGCTKPTPTTRAGLEYCRVSGDRPGLAPDFDPRTGGSTVTAEYRFSF